MGSLKCFEPDDSDIRSGADASLNATFPSPISDRSFNTSDTFFLFTRTFRDCSAKPMQAKDDELLCRAAECPRQEIPLSHFR